MPGALRTALLARRIDRAEHRRLRAEFAASRAALRRLEGTPRAELTAVLRNVEALARTRRLYLEPPRARLPRAAAATASTGRAAPTRPPPATACVFGRDPAVFQYYPGQGMQLQQLASWGRLNAKLEVCLRKPTCRVRRRLRRELARMVALGAQRGGFLAWEYYFSFGGGTPPWISGMTQGTAVQALARGAVVFDEERWGEIAERALGAFQAPPPVGVSQKVRGGRHYLMYSFNPGLRILNGDLQAITGLRDLADLGGSRTARVLYRRGERAARRAVDRFDTGAWSLYSEGGREAPLGYHQLVGQFLDNLCRRTALDVYCRRAQPLRQLRGRAAADPPRPPVAGCAPSATTSVRFGLSKISTVSVRVTGARGFVDDPPPVAPARRPHRRWTPPARGSYSVRVSAKGPSGPRGASTRRACASCCRARQAQEEGSAAVDAGHGAVAEGVHEAAVIVAGELAVGRPELRQVLRERLGVVADHLGDRLLGLEVDQRLVGARVGDAVHLGGRLAERAQQRRAARRAPTRRPSRGRPRRARAP